MKKKWEQRGTIKMIFAVGEHYTSFEAGSVFLTPAEIKSAVESIARTANIDCVFMREYRFIGFGFKTEYCSFHGHIPFDKMPDFIKAARAAGFRVKE